MPALSTSIRNKLEEAVKQARRVAEIAARAALEALAVHEAAPYPHMDEPSKRLRNHLRARARQLGDAQTPDKRIRLDRIVHECAYEHWHRMLFARFLAENNLLVEPDSGVAITLEECKELAAAEKTDLWAYASRLAQRMLPSIFRPSDPLLQVTFAREHRLKLEGILAGLADAVFAADDALGWVYQFWRAEEKDAVNKAGDKINADTLPAVTQLFTEHYMVEFLLHNTLGAWWTSKRVAEASSLCSSRTGYLNPDEPIINLTGDLPHWRQEGVTYFITFRCADALPQAKLTQWKQEIELWMRHHPEPHDAATRADFYERFPRRIQDWLDAGYGECLLARPDCRQIVENALRHFDQQRYDLGAFVVAGNHVHVLVAPRPGNNLSEILHSWKSFTASEINKLLSRSGAFWQKESFDHIVRNPASLEKIHAYIRAHGKVAEASSFCPPDKQRQDASATSIPLAYLRRKEDGSPAAGTFPGWPRTVRELRAIDPSCGSGHFLVALLQLLVAMRREEEGLDVEAAVRAVLTENLHGLEIDARCSQLAAFNVAFAAWKLIGRPTELPALHIACSGLSVGGTREEWMQVAEASSLSPADQRQDASATRFFLGQLYDLFKKAPDLGSLINPGRLIGGSMHADKLEPLLKMLDTAFAREDAVKRTLAPEEFERGVTAQGLARAAQLLAGRYHLSVTNVPYLASGKQDEPLKTHIETHYPAGKTDLATAFVLRCLEFCAESGTVALVTPQNWLFLSSYKKLREHLLERIEWNWVARLGARAFETITGEVVNVALLSLTRKQPTKAHELSGLDVAAEKSPRAKNIALKEYPVFSVRQDAQLRNPDARLAMEESSDLPPLATFASCIQGLATSDDPQFTFFSWEFPQVGEMWSWLNGTVDFSVEFGGRERVLLWENGSGRYFRHAQALKTEGRLGGWKSGTEARGKRGVLVSQMQAMPVTLYTGDFYDHNASVIILQDNTLLPAVWCFASSPEFCREVRKLDQSLKPSNNVFVQVPFDLAHWQKTAAEKYPHGLPKPHSDDPTQSLFSGHPRGATEPLQVAVARLLGYQWPRQTGSEFPDCPALGPDGLEEFADEDGIVCLSAIHGEAAAADRLQRLLAAAWESGRGFQPLSEGAHRQDAGATVETLLAAAGYGHKTLDDWLRDKFFEQHCALFHQRPFIWHIWDGQPRGFSALVNYHKLCGRGFQPLNSEASEAGSLSHSGRKVLEKLTYTYLGDWISRQTEGVRNDVAGADDRLAAALELKKRLVAILAGEPPFDLFARWKPLHQQPIDWEPDVNDGVRVNIRPFMASDLPTGKRDAGILRNKPNVKWDKDRGKEPRRLRDEFPWFWDWDGHAEDFPGGDKFTGDRWNDCHYTTEAKNAARAAKTP